MKLATLLAPLAFVACSSGPREPNLQPVGDGLTTIGIAIVLASLVFALAKFIGGGKS